MLRNKLLIVGALGAIGLGALLIATPVANAQTTTTGAIQGSVKDAANGSALEGVTIVATSAALQGSQSELTDDDGDYFLGNLPPGTYEVVFYYSDIKQRRTNVIVSVGATTPLHVKMDTTGKEKDITVPVKTHTIDVANTKQGTTLTKDYTQNVPNRGRTYEGVLGAAAGSQGDDLGIAFSGSGSVENNYVIDGINTTGLTYGDGGSPLINDFIQEIEIITGGYNAEFGRSTGGVVNVVTKSGGNEFHGTVFANARPFEAERENVFVADTALDGRSTLAYDIDFGFDLGGPIVKDKVWFYVGFAPQMQSFTITRVASTRVDRQHNDVQYTVNPDGTLADGDGRADTDPNTGCERLPRPADPDGPGPMPQPLTACEADNLADIDQQTGFELFEEIERKEFSSSAASYQFLGKVNIAANPDNQGQISIIGSPGTGHGVGVTGTPLGTQSDGTSLVLDTSIKWTSKFLDNKLELDAVIGWHHEKVDAGAIDGAADSIPQITADRSNLGAIGRNPDQPESNSVLQFCTDNVTGAPAITDDFPTITNCPVVGYRFNSVGGFQDNAEDRYTGKIAATYRLKLAGHHKIKAGLDFEDNFLKDFDGLSGGRRYRLNGSARYWRIFTYARRGDMNGQCTLDKEGTVGPCPNTCGFAADGMTPVPCNYLGEPGDEFRRSSETFNWAGFLQDSWQILPNLTVNAGIRYEEQKLKTAKEIRGAVDTITGDVLGADALDLNFLVAPRVGALYDWTKEGRSKIYANWGRFFESVPMDINNRAFGGEAFYEGFWDARDANICTPWAMDPRGVDFTPLLPSDPRTCDTNQAPVVDQFIGGGNDALGLPPGVSSLIAPGLKPQYLDEFVAGVEYELIEDLRLGLSYQNRALGRVIEDTSTDGANTYIISNPGEFPQAEEDKLVAQIAAETDMVKHDALQARLDMFRRTRQYDKPRREYNAVQLTVLKRFSNQFFVQGSYTYSRSSGNYPGLYSPNNGQLDPNITSQYDLIELLANRQGSLPQDRPHNLKVDGYYTFDLKEAGAITTGVRLRAISGIPISTLGAHPLYGPNEAFILPRGSWGRTDFQTGADLRLQYSRDVGKDMRLTVSFDLFNVFNQQTQAGVDEQYTQDSVNPIIGGTKDDLNYLKVSDGLETREIAQKTLNYANTDSRSSPLAGRFGLRLEF